MIIPFYELPLNSKVWIYSTPHPFSDEQKRIILSEIENFLINWKDQDKPIISGIDLRENQFITIATYGNDYVDGCALDELIRLIKKLETLLSISLLNRTNIYYKNNGIEHLSLNHFKKALLGGNITPEVMIINTTASTLEEYIHSWEIPLKESWLKRYL